MPDLKPKLAEPLRPVTKKASFARTIKAVLWSFFGIRGRGGLEGDLEGNTALNPVHVIVAAVLAAALFVGILVTIAHGVVKHVQ